jgi:hypothetical protein
MASAWDRIKKTAKVTKNILDTAMPLQDQIDKYTGVNDIIDPMLESENGSGKLVGPSLSEGQLSGMADDEKRNLLLSSSALNPGRKQTTQTKRRSYLNTSNSSQFLTNAAAPQRSLLNLGQ